MERRTMIKRQEQNETTVVVECTSKQDFKKLESEWKKLGIKMNREFKVQERGHYVIEYTKQESEYATIKNTEVREILEEYEFYGWMTGSEFKAFKDYHRELESNHRRWNDMLECDVANGRNPLTAQIMTTYINPEFEQIHHLNEWRIYSGSITSCYYMNAELRHLWDLECSGYTNNAFFNFKKVVEMVNAYWKIKTPFKPSSKIAYGWKFSMSKATMENGYHCKNWRLYMFGCIKNYLIKNGIEFTKEESLKVRKIVGLAELYDTIE